MSQNLSSAAVVIGALRVNALFYSRQRVNFDDQFYGVKLYTVKPVLVATY